MNSGEEGERGGGGGNVSYARCTSEPALEALSRAITNNMVTSVIAK